MEDERIGRALAPQAFTVAVATGAPVDLVQADSNRVRMVVSSDGTGTLFLAPEGITPAALTGFALTPGEPIITIDSKVWGKLAAGKWRAFASAGTIQVSVMTASLDKQ